MTTHQRKPYESPVMGTIETSAPNIVCESKTTGGTNGYDSVDTDNRYGSHSQKRMVTLFSVALMSLAVTLTSCQKEEEKESPVKPDPPAEKTIKASIEKYDTKVTLLLDRKVIWNNGDSISINGVKFVGTPTTEDPAVADFVQVDNQMPPKLPFHAFFPAGIRTQEYDADSGCLPDRQIYAEGKLDNAPMYAYCDDESYLLNFKHLCGVLAVKVDPEDIDKVASIRVSSSEEAMSGDFKVVDDSVAVLTDDAKRKMGNVVLVCEDPVTIEEKTWFLIAIPAQKYSDINIELSSDGKTYTKGMLTKEATGDSISVDRGTVYPVEFVADAPTANCYIATKDTILYFRTCIGNSAEPLRHVKYAKVLWESDGTNGPQTKGSLIKSVSYQSGWITCETTANKGNAVIAACDEDDVILWSWHIWLTDQPEEQEYNRYAGTMMDRNLGATSASSSEIPGVIGLLYQWGRKDPFLGACNRDIYLDSSIRAASTNPDIWDTMRALVSVSTTVRYPTSFVTSITGAWCLGSNGVWNADKTLYDPCPAGWRVPDGGLLGVWNRAASGSAPLFRQAEYGFECGNSDGGYFTTQAEHCWYPAAGCVNSDGKLIDAFYECHYWSCTRLPIDVLMAHCMDQKDVSQWTNKLKLSTIDSRSRALSVRCQKIDEDE